MNAAVMSTLLGQKVTDPYKYIKQGWQDTRPFMTGSLISANMAHSVCVGTVIDVGVDDKNRLYSVTIEYEYLTWIRYCLLDSCSVKLGDKITKGAEIGKPHNGILRFEYCNNEASTFPVRIDYRCLYKQDPMVVLSGDLELPDNSEDTDNE